MKIAIFTHIMDRSAMGTALYTRKLVENLLAEKDKECEFFLVHKEKNNNPIYTQANEVIMPKVSLPRLSNFMSEALFLWKTRKDFDIIHYSQESIYPLFWLSRAKIVVTVHSAIEGWRDFGVSKWRYFLVYILLKFFQKKLNMIICSSLSTKNSIQKKFNIPENKLRVIYLGVSKQFLSAPSKAAAQDLMKKKYNIPSPYILDVARVDPHKNIRRVIRAYANLKKEGLKHFLVIGTRHLPEETKKVDLLIEELGLKNDVIFMPYNPFIADSDMPALYAGADVFVFPSLHEGFGLPILESMACGTPVITSNVFSMPEISGGAAVLVDPFSVEDITRAIKNVLYDSELRNNLVKKGKERVKQFDWRKMAKETLTVYKKVYEN